MKIEMTSDVMCPWCVIGYKNLSSALAQLDEELDAKIDFVPFELNPEMPIEGEPHYPQLLPDIYGYRPLSEKPARGPPLRFSA